MSCYYKIVFLIPLKLENVTKCNKWNQRQCTFLLCAPHLPVPLSCTSIPSLLNTTASMLISCPHVPVFLSHDPLCPCTSVHLTCPLPPMCPLMPPAPPFVTLLCPIPFLCPLYSSLLPLYPLLYPSTPLCPLWPWNLLLYSHVSPSPLETWMVNGSYHSQSHNSIALI